MRRRDPAGFTLIELMIVIAIISLLAAVLLPNVIRSQDAGYAIGDRRNLGRHYEWLQSYRRLHNGALPMGGGHRFVLATWTAGIADHTPEDLERYFTPGPARDNDPVYQALHAAIRSGENPWPDLARTTSADTHYAGRATRHMGSVDRSGNEAWMADDNENGWSLRDGTVHVLFANGAVRSYSYPQLREQCGLGDLDPDAPLRTFGEDSPIPPCRKLDR